MNEEEEQVEKLLTRAHEANESINDAIIAALNRSKKMSGEQQFVEASLLRFREASYHALQYCNALFKKEYGSIRVDLISSMLDCMEECLANFCKTIDYVPKGKAEAAAGQAAPVL